MSATARLRATRRTTRSRTGHVAVSLALLTGLPLLSSTGAGADPPAQDWSTLRACESSGRYEAVAAHGHYGAYQFDLPTWASVGGTGLPSDATPAEQDYRALYLYRMRGWQPWECARMRGLVPDADAGSARVPDRVESAYMAPDARLANPAEGVPAWPGVVYTYGDCAQELRAWQLRMNARGYDFVGTGCYRDKTREAVLDLQHRTGLTPSGKLGPRTWQAAWTAP
jgi:hypothetical protein